MVVHAAPYKNSSAAHLELLKNANKSTKSRESIAMAVRDESCHMNNERMGPRMMAKNNGIPNITKIPMPSTPASPSVDPFEALISVKTRYDAKKEISPKTLKAL